MPKISAIVINYNGESLLDECLDSLKRQTFKDFEIVVFDNASSDNSTELVRRQYPDIKLIQSDVNLGYGGGINRAMECLNKESEYIAVLNNDTVADKNWLSAFYESAKSAPETIGMYACKVLNYYEKDVIDNTGLLFYPDGLARGRGRLEKDEGQYDSKEEVIFPSGSACIFKKEMLQETGLFDEDFFLYLEEVDLGLRAIWKGWRCLYIPDAVVYHRYSYTTEPYSPMKVFYVERNRIWVVLKNFPSNLILLSIGYSLLRYLYQFFGLMTKRGAPSRFLSQQPFRRGVWILLNAYYKAFSELPKICKKRKGVFSSKKISSGEFLKTIKKFRIPVSELAMRD